MDVSTESRMRTVAPLEGSASVEGPGSGYDTDSHLEQFTLSCHDKVTKSLQLYRAHKIPDERVLKIHIDRSSDIARSP